jgi:hypothetical protein
MEPDIRLPATQLREYEFENKLAPCRGQLIIEYNTTPGLAFKVIAFIIMTQFSALVKTPTVLRVVAWWVLLRCALLKSPKSYLVLHRVRWVLRGTFKFPSSTFPSPSGKPGEATGGISIVKKCLSNKAFNFFSYVLPFVFDAAASPSARMSSTFWSASLLASSLSALSLMKRSFSAFKVLFSFVSFCRFACSLFAKIFLKSRAALAHL